MIRSRQILWGKTLLIYGYTNLYNRQDVLSMASRNGFASFALTNRHNDLAGPGCINWITNLNSHLLDSTPLSDVLTSWDV